MIRKVVACLTRPRADDGGTELLVFTHPNGTVQVPKGTLEDGEDPRSAVLRELEEESGLSGASIRAHLADLRVFPRGRHATGPYDDQLWHVFLLDASGGAPDTWRHRAVGSAEEEGLVFSFEWLRLLDAHERLDPLFRPVWKVLCAEDP